MTDEEISAGGSRIYRHTERPADQEIEIADGDPKLIDAVSEHVERHVGPIERVFHELISPAVHLDVIFVAPSEEGPWYTLVTCGMSAKPMQAPSPDETLAELTLALPPDWPMDESAWHDERHYWPVRLLKFLARLPHEYDTWLGTGHTVPNDDPPKPYARGTRLCGALIAPPLLTPDAFDVLQRPGDPINFYGVIALHHDEMDLKLAKGGDALGALLDAARVSELVQPDRPSLVAPRRRSLFRRR